MTAKKIRDRYSTVIWDWNGTLLNDTRLCVKIVNGILPAHNTLQLDEQAYKEVFGFPIVDYYKRIGIDFNIESFESLTQKFISNYDKDIKNYQLHDKAIDVLMTNKKNGIDQFILTAGHKESVSKLLEHFVIKDFFIEIEGLDNHRAESKVERGKKLIEKNLINKEETVLVGDTIHDFEVANELGVDCILISNGHQSKERLIKETFKKVVVLDNIMDLLI